jgi:hypothetical protein
MQSQKKKKWVTPELILISSGDIKAKSRQNIHEGTAAVIGTLSGKDLVSNGYSSGYRSTALS